MLWKIKTMYFFFRLYFITLILLSLGLATIAICVMSYNNKVKVVRCNESWDEYSY